MSSAILARVNDEAWQSQGNCANVDPDVMHPVEASGIPAAKAVCRGCPVIELCLEAHLKEKYGVWAGLDEDERRKIVRRMRP